VDERDVGIPNDLASCSGLEVIVNGEFGLWNFESENAVKLVVDVGKVESLVVADCTGGNKSATCFQAG
jgi:hypothetical protein